VTGVTPFDWDGLAAYKLGGVFPAAYPASTRTWWSGRDDVHGVLKALIGSAQHSLIISMFGWDDDELDALVRSKMEDEHVFVQMSLDRTQAGGAHEKKLLANWNPADITNSVAIGTSPNGAILHLKMVVVDGVYVVHGSTNWSVSGESLQANEMTLTNDAGLAAEARTVLDIQHQHILAQQGARAKGVPA
jgi:phosphatidylserine/phosphatidylglycerophosphate/cardiolipin synthase-like enzyme